MQNLHVPVVANRQHGNLLESSGVTSIALVDVGRFSEPDSKIEQSRAPGWMSLQPQGYSVSGLVAKLTTSVRDPRFQNGAQHLNNQRCGT